MLNKIKVSQIFKNFNLRYFQSSILSRQISKLVQFHSGGDDFCPLKDMEGLGGAIGNNPANGFVFAWRDDVERKCGEGEKRLYAIKKNPDTGEVLACNEIYLKNDGTIELNSGKDLKIVVPEVVTVECQTANIKATSSVNIDSPVTNLGVELYATGLYSYTSLAKQLREEGFQISPSVKVGRSNIEDILNNPIYIGDFIFKGKRYYNAKHDPIVSRDIYATCQRIIAEHTNFKPTQREFLYSNMIKCKKCGCTFTAELKKGRYVYYHCTGNRGGNCKKASYIREEKIEAKILEVLEQFKMPAEYLELAKKCLIQEYENKYGDNESRIEKVENQIKKEKQKLNRLLDLFISGACSEEIYNKKSKEIETYIDDLTIRMQSYHKTGFDILHYSVRLFELMGNAVNIYKGASFEEKRNFVNMICSNFYYDGENLTIIIKKAFQSLIGIANLKMVGVRRLELLTSSL